MTNVIHHMLLSITNSNSAAAANSPTCCRISELGGLLQHREQVLAVVEAEAEEIAAKFGSPRCTVMSTEASSSMSVEDIIPNSQSLVVFSRKGYIKRIPADTFSVQHRGGRGELCCAHPSVHE